MGNPKTLDSTKLAGGLQQEFERKIIPMVD